MLATDNLREAERLMTICNACRYCEGLCAVFPAMEMRRTFGAGDLNYLANLCHQCGACFPDCQYSPPHEFNVNVPATLAKLRNDSYADYVWPRALAGVFARNGLLVALLCAASVAAFIIGFVAFADPAALWSRNAGDFYKVMPHRAMVVLFGAGRALRDRRVRFQPARLLARHRRRRARARRAGAGGRRHLHAALSRRRGRRLHIRERRAVVAAPRLSPFHVLRLPALLRRDLRRHALPLRLRLARALRRSTACRCCSASSAASAC